MSNFLFVMLGGALGSALRYALALMIVAPYATLVVNVFGSLMMGMIIGLGSFVLPALPEAWRLFLAVGVLGGFTTFSSFSGDVLLLIERGAVTQAIVYIFLSLLLSLFAVFAGVQLVKAFSS